jgi:hypothetical protein
VRLFLFLETNDMATSLSALLGNAPPPQREKPPRAVEVRLRKPHDKSNQFFDVILANGMVLRGFLFHEGRLIAPSYDFVDRKAKEEFAVAVLAALDAEGG